MSDEKLSVTTLADLSAILLSISVNFAFREHSLLVQTILTVTMATELTEEHL